MLNNDCVVFMQITFAIPYIPDGGRRYDYRAFNDIVDFMFIMAYDETGVSRAWANSPFNTTAQGAFFDSRL